MEAVVFDMDGVIVDSEEYWDRLKRQLFEGSLEDIEPERAMEEVKGMNYREAYEVLDRKYGMSMEEQEFVERFDEAADVVYGERSSLMEGFRSILKRLRGAGLKTAVVSSSPQRWIGIVFQEFGLEELFDEVVSAENLDSPGKPEPDIYLRAAEQVGAEPGECVAVEDSDNGIEAAERAGMYCIGYRNYNRKADSVADSPEDMMEKIHEAVGEGF